MKLKLLAYSLSLGVSLLLITISGYAAQNNYQAGKDYQVISGSSNIPEEYAIPKGKIQVIEFFSYGCPWCYRMQPILAKWLKNKPANVEFEKIPVMFEPGWSMYSKAYYTGKALGITEKLSPALFDAIQKQGKDLTNPVAMQAFFATQGVNADTFKSAFDESPQITIQLNQANTMMLAYQVMHIPAFVVDGKYKTDAGMAGGDQQMIPILNYLIGLASKS